MEIFSGVRGIPPNFTPEKPEPPVVKQGFFVDRLVWPFLGAPENDARRAAENINRGIWKSWNTRRAKHAIRTELNEVFISDTMMFARRTVGRVVVSVFNQGYHLALHAVGTGIPLVSRAISFAQIIRAGAVEKIIPEAALSTVDVTAAGVVTFLVATGIGTLLVPIPVLAAAGIDFVVQGSMRKHNREVENKLIPHLHRLMSPSLQRNPHQDESKRRTIANVMSQVNAEKGRKEKFQKLPDEERRLDPVNGLTPRKRRTYARITAQLNDFRGDLEVRQSFLYPTLPLNTELRDVRESIASNFHLLTREQRLKKRKIPIVRRDIKTLKYFIDTFGEDKNERFDHPFYEVRRLREMLGVARRYYPLE